MTKKTTSWVSLVIDTSGNFYIMSRSPSISVRNEFGISGKRLTDEHGNVWDYRVNSDETKLLIRVADWQEEERLNYWEP